MAAKRTLGDFFKWRKDHGALVRDYVKAFVADGGTVIDAIEKLIRLFIEYGPELAKIIQLFIDMFFSSAPEAKHFTRSSSAEDV